MQLNLNCWGFRFRVAKPLNRIGLSQICFFFFLNSLKNTEKWKACCGEKLSTVFDTNYKVSELIIYRNDWHPEINRCCHSGSFQRENLLKIIFENCAFEESNKNRNLFMACRPMKNVMALWTFTLFGIYLKKRQPHKGAEESNKICRIFYSEATQKNTNE